MRNGHETVGFDNEQNANESRNGPQVAVAALQEAERWNDQRDETNDK